MRTAPKRWTRLAGRWQGVSWESVHRVVDAEDLANLELLFDAEGEGGARDHDRALGGPPAFLLPPDLRPLALFLPAPALLGLLRSPRLTPSSFGLVPVVGDVVTAAMGAWLIWEAKNLGMSKFHLARMGGNVAFDTAVGLIPFAGDAFDFLFRSNTRNLRIIKRWLDKHHPGTLTIDGGPITARMNGALIAGGTAVTLTDNNPDLIACYRAVVDCPEQKRRYMLDAWVFAPSRGKYRYLVQMEALLDGFECGSD